MNFYNEPSCEFKQTTRKPVRGKELHTLFIFQSYQKNSTIWRWDGYCISSIDWLIVLMTFKWWNYGTRINCLDPVDRSRASSEPRISGETKQASPCEPCDTRPRHYSIAVAVINARQCDLIWSNSEHTLSGESNIQIQPTNPRQIKTSEIHPVFYSKR